MEELDAAPERMELKEGEVIEQGQLGDFDAPPPDALQHLGHEMQPGGGRGDGARHGGIAGQVGVSVRLVLGGEITISANIGRQGRQAELLQPTGQGGGLIEAKDPAALVVPAQGFRRQLSPTERARFPLVRCAAPFLPWPAIPPAPARRKFSANTFFRRGHGALALVI